jgi:hypothetical protein
MSYAEAVARVTQIERERAVIRTTFEHTATASVSFADELAQAQGSVSAQPVAQVASSAPTVQGTLTSGQQQFASTLAADTGLDPQVIGAWLLSEESGEAAVSRQAANNNDWLNIGYTDSGTYGSTDSIWSSPITAAEATAGWLNGRETVTGYGTASSGIQAILDTAGQPAPAQIAAIQQSGWASSGYPDLPTLYQQLSV